MSDELRFNIVSVRRKINTALACTIKLGHISFKFLFGKAYSAIN